MDKIKQAIGISEALQATLSEEQYAQDVVVAAATHFFASVVIAAVIHPVVASGGVRRQIEYTETTVQLAQRMIAEGVKAHTAQQEPIEGAV